MTSKNKNNIAFVFLKTLGIKQIQTAQLALTEKLLLTAAVPKKIYFDKPLSTQETNCLLLAAKGLTISETANLLNIKRTTVITHRANILKKLSCSSIAQAVFESIRFGYFKQE